MALTDNLIAFWELEETSGTRVDAHGANDLADNNTVLSGTGKVGTAADFEQTTSESLSIADNADLSLGVDQSFTIACWVNLESADAGVLVGKAGGPGGNGEFELRSISNSFRLRTWSGTVFGGQGEVSDAAAGATNTATWYFVVCGYDATNDLLFMQRNNGTEYTTTGVTAGARDDNGAFALGALGDYGSGYFDGLIDQVGLWKRVLTSTERTQLYNSGNGLSYAGMTGGGGGATYAVFPRWNSVRR